MSIALVVISDRSEYIAECLDSCRKFVPELFEPPNVRFLVNDAAELGDGHREYLADIAPEFRRIHHSVREGMAGAVSSGWAGAQVLGADFVFHIEEDFRLTGPIPLTLMASVLDYKWELSELVLKRPPWGGEELAAGSSIQLMEQRGSPTWQIAVAINDEAPVWIEHEHIFSLNPSLIPKRVYETGWPHGPLGTGNEAGMTTKMLSMGYRFAFWGARDDAPLCEHVGHHRSAAWAL